MNVTLPFDLATYDPDNEAHRRAVDDAYGLPEAVPMCRVDYLGSAILMSGLNVSEAWSAEELLERPFPWAPPYDHQARARADARLRRLLDRCHVEDRETVLLSLTGMTQGEVGLVLGGISQHSVSSRLKAARQRLALAEHMPHLSWEEVAEDITARWEEARKSLRGHASEVVGRWAGALYWIPSQHTVGRPMGLSQGTVAQWARTLRVILPEGHPVLYALGWPWPGSVSWRRPYRGPDGGEGWRVAHELGLDH